MNNDNKYSSHNHCGHSGRDHSGHKGSITVKSKLGLRTKFVIKLPFQ